MVCLRNPLQPVNRLPPEIIALCAAFVPHTDPRPIVSLTHVCRYWREAITSNPGSWTLIGSDWKELVPLCLERAGAAPLTANIWVSDIKEDGDFTQALLPHVPRISHLSLRGYPFIRKLEAVLPNFFASPMLNLTSLELDQDGESANLFPSKEAPTPQLFQNVSKLKSLHLSGIPLYPVLHNIESLVELKLAGYRFPFQEFIGFLESNPNLEILDLDISFPSTPALTAPERCVSFPRLRRLSLDCEFPINTRVLLSCLSLPRGVKIEVRHPDWDTHDLASFLPCPSTHIQDLLAPITTIKHSPSPGWLHLSGNNGSFSFYSQKTLKRLYEEFTLFATTAVREFHLPLGNQARLSWALERLPALETLIITGGRLGPEFLSALAGEPVLCPSLNTIAFLDCEVTGEAVCGLEGILAKREHSTAARLHRVAIVNRTVDLPNQRLVSQLQKFVPRVDIAVGDELPDSL